MKTTGTAVESLLKQMRLKEPSENLDQAIDDLTLDEVVELPQRPSEVVGYGRFGWAALVSTAVAASVFGLLLGQFVSVFPTPQSAIRDIRVPGMSQPFVSNSDRSRQIVPVKFNVGAFEMMHGHSQREEFTNCTSCHMPGEQDEEAFEGWYYGDEEFFETHDFKGVAKCSACHVLSDTNPLEQGRIDLSDSELPDLHGFSPEFFNSECSDCHTVFSDTHPLEQGRIDLSDPELPDLHGFSPEFLDSECSDCHSVSPG